MIADVNGAMMASVVEHFDELIDRKAIVPATKERIDKYADGHEIHAAWSRLAKRQAGRASASSVASLDVLGSFLRLMKEGGAESDFEVQVRIRRDNLAAAPGHLQAVACWQGTTARDFFIHYDQLTAQFHSGGLNRAKTRIAKKRNAFVRAVASIIDKGELSPREAFAILHTAFGDIKGAGINLLTEILHTLDDKRFAVMNQNSVAGLRLAGYNQFPRHPSKSCVTPESYQLYCNYADGVRKALKLRDFTELDALFNYVYWHEGRAEQNEEVDIHI